jgi:hypothetical protein
MRLRKIMSVVAVLACGLLLCSCLTQEQHDAAMRVVDELVKAGTMTDAQAAAMRNAIDQASQFRMLEPVLGAAAAILGVRIQRGPSAPPDERVERKRKYRAIRKKNSATSPAKQEN